jgi:hypothetical protein
VESDETKQGAERPPADTVRSVKRTINAACGERPNGNGASSDAAPMFGGSVKQAAADTVEMIVR